MEFWALLCFWCLAVSAGSQNAVALGRVNVNRDFYVAGLEEPAPSVCYYYTYTWIATEGAPFTTPLYPSWDEPGSSPTGNFPGIPGQGNPSYGATAPFGTASGEGIIPGGGTVPATTIPGTGPTTSPTVVPPGTLGAGPITLAEGRAFSIDLDAYLTSASDVVLSITTQPNENFIRLNVAQKTLTGTAPEVDAELAVAITVLASTNTNAAYAPKRWIGTRDAGYAINITLQVQPVTAVPVTTGNSFAINLNRYLESASDTVSLVTKPSSPWVTYDSATHVVSGTVPSTSVAAETNITVNAVNQNGTTYSRFFRLYIEPVQSVPEITGNTFSIRLKEYLLASSDNITSVALDPTAPWITFSSSDGTLSGTVPTSLNNGTILVTVFAGSNSRGFSYSFQLRLDISNITHTSAVNIPIVASNNFGINMTQYFPTASVLTAISTKPTVNWVNLDSAGKRVYGLVPDLTTGTNVTITVNASSTGTRRAAELYTRQFFLKINANHIPSFNLTLGNQFTLDLGMDLLSVPGDYITSITSNPDSKWLALDAEGTMVTGTVPSTLAAGTSVVLTANALDPSLGSSYGKQFNLVIAAGQNITVPVVVGDAFQVNLTDYLEAPGDSIQPLTTSPDVDWVQLHTAAPPYVFGTVPSGFTGSDVNITVSVVSQTTGLTYSILVILEVFQSAAVVPFGNSNTFFLSLVPLLKTNMDLVDSIQTFPTASWVVFDQAGRSISGTVPADQPNGSTVNVTVDALTTDASAADYERVFNKIISPRQTVYYSFFINIADSIHSNPFERVSDQRRFHHGGLFSRTDIYQCCCVFDSKPSSFLRSPKSDYLILIARPEYCFIFNAQLELRCRVLICYGFDDFGNN